MKVRDLLTDESKWTKDTYARDKDGNATTPGASDAVCWCLVGALERCYIPTSEFGLVYERLARRTDGAAKWNDASERTFPEVRALVEELDI